jgi:phosphatidate phosphatase APP1
VSAAKQLTSLPRLPKAPSQESLDLDIQVSKEELRQQEKEHQERMKHEQLADGVPEHEHPLEQAHGQPSTSKTSPTPRRTDTMTSIASTASIATTSSSFAVTYSSAPLQVLHDNLHARLRLFFSQKLVGRRIRISIYLVPAALESSPRAPEVCIAKGTLITESGGVFKSSITVPWNGEDPHRRQLRVRAELLSEVEDETIDSEAALEAVMARSDEASVGLSHAHTKIRVISDIDDTIKLTHVLAGIKSVVRNVFTRPHDELVVPGMQQWYWTLYEKGVS